MVKTAVEWNKPCVDQKNSQLKEEEYELDKIVDTAEAGEQNPSRLRACRGLPEYSKHHREE